MAWPNKTLKPTFRAYRWPRNVDWANWCIPLGIFCFAHNEQVDPTAARRLTSHVMVRSHLAFVVWAILSKEIRPGSDYQWSLDLLKRFKARVPQVPTKSGIMVGLGETNEEVRQVMTDLRAHDVDMITIGQYLQPSREHAPVKRFVTPQEIEEFRQFGEALGFCNVASGPMVRSSYHADLQHKGEGIDMNPFAKGSKLLQRL